MRGLTLFCGKDKAIEAITLLLSSGQERVDQALQTAIRHFETTFPGRVSGYYVEGSYATGTGIATSDLDLSIVFRGHFADEAERASARAMVEQCASESPVEFDASVLDEASLCKGASPQFKLGSTLVYGEDIRDQIPLIPIEVWTRDRMHAAYWLMVNIFNRPKVLRLPLGFPNPNDEWRGYASRKVRLPDGTEVPSTRNLIRSTGWAATALLALHAKRYITSKRECHMIYRAVINDEWATLFEDMYLYCREHWQYLLPQTEEGRQRLRTMCERTLAFENHFLGVYKNYLLAQISSADEASITHALWVLGQITFDDAEVQNAVRALRRPFPLVF
jgi:hypothetical protein